jgi:hypothetical protein
MPDLKQSLSNQDLGYLRIVADSWGIELTATDLRNGIEILIPHLLDRSLLHEEIESLPKAALAGLQVLLGNNGRLPWAVFIRRFGEVREMGAGRRDRERPFEEPISSAEVLWYRALIGRAFFDSPDGPQEFAYIPTDLIPLLPNPQNKTQIIHGNPASPNECALPIPADDHILDHACTLLAAHRIGLPIEQLSFNTKLSNLHGVYPLSPHPLQQLLVAAGLIAADGQPELEETRLFLESSREEGLAKLVQAWLLSDTFDELRLIPELQMEGEWINYPGKTRATVIGFLSSIPGGKWWSMKAFVNSVHQHEPDFQRPAGDYDTWFIRQRGSGEYLRGFDHWDAVDGSLLRYMISGPMHWLGIIDLAFHPTIQDGEKMQTSSFRLSSWSESLLSGNPPAGFPMESASIQVSSSGMLRVPRLTPRPVRYQIARFCDWEKEEGDIYRYMLTPHSLSRAREQGLSTSHLLTMIRRATSSIPPSLVKALARWEQHGSQAKLDKVVVLRFDSPRILQELRASRAARFLGETLGPTAVIVKPGAWEKVVAVLAEMGYLTETQDEISQILI